MKEIKLTQGKVAWVDDDMFEELNKFNWFAHKSYNVFYAERHLPTENGKRPMLKMHHAIIGFPPDGKVTDHEDGHGLHNERHNLRHVTNRQNCQNKKHMAKSSKYPGVDWAKSRCKWRSRIRTAKGRKHLGYFSSEHEAFQAYQTAVESIGEKVIG